MANSHLSVELFHTTRATRLDNGPIHMGHPTSAEGLIVPVPHGSAEACIVPVPYGPAEAILYGTT
jgi:hypothetical protein